MENGLSIIIPNYNGKDLLERNLPSLIKAASLCQLPTEIIIADDASTDDSVDYIHTRFSDVKVIKNESNLGFGENCNRAVNVCQYDHFILLNSDIKVEETFIEPLITTYNSSPDIFAVSCKMIETSEEGNIHNVGFNYGLIRKRVIQTEIPLLSINNPADTVPREILWACGGAALYNKSRFLEVGGFDPIYAPFYWEDTDVSYQAWKRGWHVFYEPKSIVYHSRSKTIKSLYKEQYINQIKERNRLLFMIKNITTPKYTLLFILHYIFKVILYRYAKAIRLTKRSPKCDPLSLSLIINTIRKRKLLTQYYVLSDDDIFNRFIKSKDELETANSQY